MSGSIYIHIPFCLKKCVYCDFYSVPFDQASAERYLKAICKEIELRSEPASDIKTIYIGGGTPTILSGTHIAKIMNTIRTSFNVLPRTEITIETNPKTITPEKAGQLISAGINRISIGIQSFIDKELRLLGRVHNSEDAYSTLSDVRKAGFENISIDLIYGIPGQTAAQWEYTLHKALELHPEHISAYELTPEKNTPLYRDLKAGKLSMPDEDIISEMYYKCIDTLTEGGYLHYEISNFAKPGFECRHNLNYWDRGEYLGIGAGAHSFLNGKRRACVDDITQYTRSIAGNVLPETGEIEISEAEALNETIFLGLRKTEGIDLRLLPDKIIEAAEDIISHGLAEMKDNHLRLTRKGLILSNEAIVKVLLCIEKPLPS